MHISEIRNRKWKVADGLRITENSLSGFILEEQECHFNVLRKGYDSDAPEIRVCCSHQSYITKLSRSALFLLKEILISSAEGGSKGVVLQISGTLEYKGLRIVKTHSTRQMSEEHKQKMAQALSRYKSKKGDTIGDNAA